MKSALDYLIGEKLFHFVQAAKQHPEFAAELPTFLAEIERLFQPEDIGKYLEKTKYLAPQEPEFDSDELEEDDDEEWPDNPIMGAEELLRSSRIRQLLHR
jgi:hypothetical protein